MRRTSASRHARLAAARQRSEQNFLSRRPGGDDPTTHLFTAGRLTEAAQLGATPFVLWGAREACMKAAENRIKKKMRDFDPVRYARRNDPTFAAYGLPEYDSFRVDAFRHDGSRYPLEEWVAVLIKRTTD